MESEKTVSLSHSDRLQILSLAQGLVLSKHFGIFRLEDICKAMEAYVAEGKFPDTFSEHYKSLIEKSGFPYRNKAHS